MSVDLSESFCEIAPILVPAVHSDNFYFLLHGKNAGGDLQFTDSVRPGHGTLRTPPSLHLDVLNFMFTGLGPGSNSLSRLVWTKAARG